MNIADIIAAERVTSAAHVPSKKRALEQLAALLAGATPYLTAGEVFSGLIAREKLGSTGIGDGVAVPHARLEGVDECIGAFVRFPAAVPFEASDGQPVDLMFGLVVPEQATQAHLDLLHCLAEMLSDPACRAQLRNAASDKALLDTLVRHSPAAHTDAG